MPKTTQKRTKWRGWMPAIIACAVLIGSATWVAALLPPRAEQVEPRSDGQASGGTVITTAYAKVLKEWDGRVALFSEGQAEPLTVYDIYVATLPEEERQLLKEGIVVNNEEALASILENYTS